MHDNLESARIAAGRRAESRGESFCIVSGLKRGRRIFRVYPMKGFGLPPGSPSLGELLNQGKSNLQAPWLGITAFAVLALMLSLLIFIGEAVRDAFDPRKT